MILILILILSTSTHPQTTIINMEAPLPVDEPTYVAFFGVMGATAAMVFSALGAAYGTAKSGTGRIL